MASPPFSIVIEIGFLAAFILWIGTVNRLRDKPENAMWRTTTTVALPVLLLFLCAIELRHREPPTVTGLPSDHLVVIEDSISAGVDPRVESWPTVMQETTGVSVRSLARPGADLVEASAIASKLTPEDRIVLIEIGGNDLLSGISSREFARRLEDLLRKVVVPNRVAVMFELPSLPLWTPCGRVQRGLASKYGVFLIPKRDFAAVISGENATLDGLHLSKIGTERMAALVAKILSPVLKTT